MPKRIVNGFEMFYTDSGGEGFPLVLIMGFGANVDWWPPDLLELLGREYRVIAFDNRGAGRSQVSPGPYRMKLFAQDTLALMDALAIERAHIFGMSMGGMIAQEVALRFPDRVAKLVLGCTHCGPRHSRNLSPAMVWRWIEFLGVRPKTKGRFLGHILFGPDLLKRQPEVLDAFLRAWRRAPITKHGRFYQAGAIFWFDSYSRLPQIAAPTLVLAGNRDFIIPWRNSNVLASRIPGARLEIFAGLGHGFMIEDLEATHRHIAAFLHSDQ